MSRAWLAPMMACGLVASQTQVAAQEAPQPAPETTESAERSFLRARANVDWITALRWLNPRDTSLNPGNVVLRIPQLWGQTEARVDARLDLGERATLVVRPRGLARAEWVWPTGADGDTSVDASANWTELFLNWRPNDTLQLTYGLQNFQWGPGELLAPSNRVFHEVAFLRDPLYYVRGRHLARANISIGKEWSFVALAELGHNGEDDFVAGEPFERQGQAKLEYSAPSGRGYVGITGGARVGTRPWMGEYASFSITEGLSVYVDLTHTKGSRAWYPVRSEDGSPIFARRDRDLDAWRTLALAGVRYTFVNGIDWRGEYVHQDSGYSNGEMDLAAAAAAAARTPDEFAPYLSPGLELLGRRLVLSSVRMPDLPPGRHLAVEGRYLRSLTDQSGVGFATASLDASDAVVLFLSATVTHGRETAEFARLARASVVAGSVWRW